MNNQDLMQRSSGALNTRLTVAFIAIIVCVGVSVLLVSQISMRLYFEEFTQKLNASIAMYINGEYQLIHQSDGKPDIGTIKRLAETAMVVNPAAEVYLLDPQGNIVGHNFPPASVTAHSVPLAPIQQILNGTGQYPLKNIDPRNKGNNKVFSAAEIRHDGTLQGYLYVVLGGEVYDRLEDNLLASYSRTQLLLASALVILAAITAGILIVRLIIRPLNQLSDRMQEFSACEFSPDQIPLNESSSPLVSSEVMIISQKFNQMQNKITEQFAMLREADQLKRQLISNVSHDLRTPLSSIQGYLETLLIKDQTLSASERHHYLNTAMNSSRRLGVLITDLFELSKLESNLIKPTMEVFSLAELTHDIVQEFNLEFAAKQISVEVANDRDNAVVFADISMIQRVFENLIRNAIAYTPAGGSIRIQTEPAPHPVHKRLKISVADTGTGISAEDLPHIFDQYFRNSDRARRDTESSGLGLTIVKRILELHDAHVEVESSLNQGTRFSFCLSEAAA